MKDKLLMALRIAKRRKIIHDAFGPRGNIGPFAATVAFESDGGEDDTALLDDEEFKSEVLGGLKKQNNRIKGLEDKQAEILKAMPTDLKTMLEDLTKLKKVANDSQANFETTEKKLASIQSLMHAHVMGGFKNPIERIERDEELRLRFNATVRLAMDKGGDMLRLIKTKFPSDFTKKALGEDSSPGSNLIDDRLAREIYDTLSMFGIWNTFQVVPVGTATTKFPVTTARPSASFVLTEAGTISDGTFTGTSVSCVVEVIAALINVSMQLLEDAEFDVTSFVMEHFAESYSERLDVACLTATGAADATNGGMTGVFVGGTAANAAAGNSTVETTDFEDWTRCLLTVDPVVLKRAAKWWMHPQILVRALSVKDLNGRPIFLTAIEAPAASSVGSILGYPVVTGLGCPTTNAATAKVAVFGDPRGNVVGMRRSYVFEASDHHRWNTLERSFRGWGRAGNKIRRALAFAMLTLTV